MVTNKSKKQILNSFLETIEGISDKEYQRRVWIRGEGPEVDDFDETVCHFSQLGDGILEDHVDFGLTECQYRLLENFRSEFEMFYREHDFPQEFINTPEWENITVMAQGILKAFNYKKLINRC